MQKINLEGWKYTKVQIAVTKQFNVCVSPAFVYYLLSQESLLTHMVALDGLHQTD